ncbi:MAG: hypothetical protein MJ245_00375 [Clostridia bacterium]|nr:hypothetical protein [Clostridia bacterium]
MNLKFVPKKYLERVAALDPEDGLIDDCKYMLYFTNDWCWDEDYGCLPVKSKKEALDFIKEARLRTEEEKQLHL